MLDIGKFSILKNSSFFSPRFLSNTSLIYNAKIRKKKFLKICGQMKMTMTMMKMEKYVLKLNPILQKMNAVNTF